MAPASHSHRDRSRRPPLAISSGAFARFPVHEVASVGARRSAQRARRSRHGFRQPVNTYYDLSAADVVVFLDSDFMASVRAACATLASSPRAAACGAPDRHEPAFTSSSRCPRLTGRKPITASLCAPPT